MFLFNDGLSTFCLHLYAILIMLIEILLTEYFIYSVTKDFNFKICI